MFVIGQEAATSSAELGILDLIDKGKPPCYGT